MIVSDWRCRDRWRERPISGSGIWFDLGAHLIESDADAVRHAGCGQRRSGTRTTDYFHAVLRRVVLHGTRDSYIKYGLDSQEDSIEGGERPENYPAYYQGILAVVRGAAPNPLPAEEAIRVMELFELGIGSTEQRKTLLVKNG